MGIPPGPLRPPDGDYIVRRMRDTPLERYDTERQLRENGCKRFRHEQDDAGRLVTHGWVRGEE